MAQDYAASVAGSHIRITRLNVDGTPMVGAKNSFVTKAFTSLSLTPEYEDGDEFTSKTAGGEICVSFKAPDTLKRVTLEIAVCNPDPELTELASGGVLLSDDDAVSVGWASPQIGIDALPNGVSVEVWSRAIVQGKPAANNPYWHWIIPYAVLRPSGDRVIENDILATAFEGWGVGNSGFGNGPAAPFWAFPEVTDRPYAYARTATVPVGNGYVAVVADTP